MVLLKAGLLSWAVSAPVVAGGTQAQDHRVYSTVRYVQFALYIKLNLDICLLPLWYRGHATVATG